ncbi:Rhodanese-like domain-containing protein [Prosthecobacter debontii]|uniref:Rhodanese-like domain-containing protein n=1 Tax=Prosthecobacter debontii TaxID=48467 RepID=A0A1T4YZA1_9BACT|nr:rhodanese-like domain-containing protein [Prosthecobacter debontii]SKB06878.1 Rhodanese-like domain-containing protein [Prosthecobacter debontii]
MILRGAVVQAVILLALAAVAAAVTYCFHPRAPALYLSQVPLREDEINLAQIQERWQGRVIWLDARPADVFAQSHIPGAHLLNEQNFNEQLLEIMDILQTADKPVVIYCGGEKCEASRTIRQKLLELIVVENCYVLQGGWPAWKAAQP